MTLYVINPNSSQNVTDGLKQALSPLEAWGHPIRCVTSVSYTHLTLPTIQL